MAAVSLPGPSLPLTINLLPAQAPEPGTMDRNWEGGERAREKVGWKEEEHNNTIVQLYPSRQMCSSGHIQHVFMSRTMCSVQQLLYFEVTFHVMCLILSVKGFHD